MTYTLLQTRGACSDFDYGDNQLFWIESDVVYAYNMIADTVTALSDGSSFDAGDDLSAGSRITSRPFVLDGGLYVGVNNEAASLLKIWKWSSGTTWVKKLEYDYSGWSDAGAHFLATLTRSETQLILSGMDAVTGAAANDYAVKYSNDGETWNNGSVTWSTTPSFTPGSYKVVRLVPPMGDAALPPLAFGQATEDSGPLGRAVVMLQWNGSAWVEIAFAEDDSPYSNPLPDAWAWNYAAGLSDPYPLSGWRDLMHWYGQQDFEDADTPTGTQSQPGDLDHYAVMTLNFGGAGKKGFGASYPAGNDVDGAALDDAYNWEADELIDDAHDLRLVARATNGTPFAVMWNVTRSANYIYSGATNFPTLASAERRYLGLAGDHMRLYVTANDGGTLKCFAYSLETLALAATATLGAATFVEVANRERGVAPVVRPGADGLIYLRGRDGNSKQVTVSEDGGETFTDTGDAGWASTKVTVALLPDPLRPEDMVAVFDDNDLYQTTDAGGSWTKLADAPATLRAAARQTVTPASVVLAAQAADTIYFSNNLGVTTEDVSDAALNTINVIEVSRG